jgi:hypothetical protein
MSYLSLVDYGKGEKGKRGKGALSPLLLLTSSPPHLFSSSGISDLSLL